MYRYSAPFLLSTAGSTRATAYRMSNKIVTLAGKTHVVWLDAVAEVRGRTFDHTTGQWGETIAIGTGCDNHTNPVLTADARGHLHLAYGPHGYWGNWNSSCVKHFVSAAPNSLAKFEYEKNFGYQATYSAMVTHPAGFDCIVYRGGEHPPQFMFQRQAEKGGWTQARPLMRQDIVPQYTHLGAQITCDRVGTIYVGGHFYNMKDDHRSRGVAVLKSTDLGATWTDLRGRKVQTPILYGRRTWVPHDTAKHVDARLAGMAVAPDGEFWAATDGQQQDGLCTPMLSRWTGDAWATIDLRPFLPAGRNPQAGQMTFDVRGHLHLAVEMGPAVPIGKRWGHPDNKVYHLWSPDRGQTFHCQQVCSDDSTLSQWLPSISAAGVFHPVDTLTFLYTRGVPGEGCSPATPNEVYAARAEWAG